MTVEVATCDPDAARHLLAAHHALMTALFEPDQNHFLDLDGLKAPDIRFFGARLGDALVGCGALALRDGYGEVKSMFVAEEARGKGVADALLARIEAEAAAQGYKVLRLETGDTLAAAHKLYKRHGFAECGAFGAYQACGSASVFMEKTIT